MASLEEVILAALLHDVGKFGQRAGANRSDRLLETFCPKKDGRHTHWHAIYTDYFIENTLPHPPNLRVNWQEITQIAANHHKYDKDSLEQSCVAIADHLSSGADRYKDTEKDEGPKGYITARLISIFEEIELKHHQFNSKKAHTYLLADMDDPEKIYPVMRDKPNESHGRTEYKELWEKFEENLKSNKAYLKKISFQNYLGTLCSTLEKYLWCIPSSSFGDIPDISLFDHCYLTASIAQALYLYHQETGGKPENSVQDKNVNKFILYGGDLSGIQKYIFKVNKSHSAGVAKLYRARSFYLQMITKSLIFELLHRLGLYSTAQVMDAGGRFMLLLPNTPKTNEIVIKFENEIEKEFLKSFKGLLTLNTCSAESSFDDLLIANFSETLDNFFDSLEKKKLNKFSYSIENESFYPVLQDDHYQSEYDGNCRISEIDGIDEKATELFQQEYDTDVGVCSICYQQICILGKDLANRDKSYFYLTRNDQKKIPGSVDLMLGWTVQFPNDQQMTQLDLTTPDLFIFNRKEHLDYAFHPIAGHLPVIRQNDLDYWKEKEINKDDMLQENHLEIGKTPKTFEMIAKSDSRYRQGKGKSFLGALKADVDNLGFVFSIGFEKDTNNRKLSISRFASLSRMLNFFFSVELVRVIEREFPNIYVVFAGGDDIFLLGPWVELTYFSVKLSELFEKFTAHNPDLTLSAGIGVYKPSLPIKDVTNSSEELLENSKSFPQKEIFKVKNAITIFGGTVSWKRFNTLLKRGEYLDTLIEKDVLTSGFAYRLLSYSRKRKSFEQGNIKDGLYISHMSYDFKRNLSEKKFTEHGFDVNSYREFVKNWKEEKDYLTDAEIPLHYSIYKNRG